MKDEFTSLAHDISRSLSPQDLPRKPRTQLNDEGPNSSFILPSSSLLFQWLKLAENFYRLQLRGQWRLRTAFPVSPLNGCCLPARFVHRRDSGRARDRMPVNDDLYIKNLSKQFRRQHRFG